MKLLDVHLRVDDGEAEHPESSELFAGEEFVVKTQASLSLPFFETAAGIVKTDSPWIAFADASLRLEERHWKALALLAGKADQGVISFSLPGLERVFGVGAASSITSSLCVVSRDVLVDAGIHELPYETLEFALFELKQKLKRVSAPREFDLRGFDSRRWIGNLMHHRIGAFARDAVRFQERHGEGSWQKLPPQFRVTTRHRSICPTVAKRGQDSEWPTGFSIICPVFKPDFVRELIDSVRRQSCPRWELLLGVDGPPEQDEARIVEEIERHQDHRIRYFVQENRGTGPTRKRLSEMAREEFVLAIDDDDMLEANALEVFSAAVEADPEGQVFRGGARLTGLLEQKLPLRPRYLINGIPNDPFEVTQPHIIKRETLRELGGYEWDAELHNAGEDTILFHKIDLAGIPVGLIDQPLYLRRLSTKNLTLQFRYEEAMAHFRNLDRKFCPAGWACDERRFELDGNFQLSRTAYVHENEVVEVVSATRFFQYQTLSDLNDLTIDLEVTARCNAVCGFCPREAMPSKKSHVSLETVRALADSLRNGPAANVVLCGIGESTMHPQLEEIVTTLRECGASVSMTSNGSLLTRETFERLVEAGLRSLNISLNADSAETHQAVMRMKNHDTVLANVHEALAARDEKYPHVRIHVSFVVCDLNESETLNFVDRWRDAGVNGIWLHPVNNRAGLLGAGLKSGNLRQYAERFADDDLVTVDLFKNHPEEHGLCKIAKSLAFISSDGEMRLCAMDYRRTTSMGNLSGKSLQQMHFEKLLSYTRGEFDEFCQGCDFCPGAAADAEVEPRPVEEAFA